LDRHSSGVSIEGEKLAIVLDIDETVLSNLPHMRDMDFGYLPKFWDESVEEGTAPAIEALRQVYEIARLYQVTVFFITGRKESDRPGTVKNLAAMSMGEYEQLICKPVGYTGTSRDYKTAARKGLEAEGFTIIANVGDQHSDLQGGYSEKIFKLVNPFYLID
jgi:predicted secreted acid phosphatase